MDTLFSVTETSFLSGNRLDICHMHWRAQPKRVWNFRYSICVLHQCPNLFFVGLSLHFCRETHILSADRLPTPISFDSNLYIFHSNTLFGCLTKNIIAITGPNREQQQFATAVAQAHASSLFRSINRKRAMSCPTHRSRCFMHCANLDCCLSHESPPSTAEVLPC